MGLFPAERGNELSEEKVSVGDWPVCLPGNGAGGGGEEELPGLAPTMPAASVWERDVDTGER
eukprot:10203496-Prorocentrum_lima.AAC.1